MRWYKKPLFKIIVIAFIVLLYAGVFFAEKMFPVISEYTLWFFQLSWAAAFIIFVLLFIRKLDNRY